MKRLAFGGALGIIIASGLALLAILLASAWGQSARANPGLSVAIDGNPSATPANTATSLGSREACILKPNVAAESVGAQCNNSLDDDSDTSVNDGCPAVGAAETGTQCDNALDDDADTKVNDGCPATGAPFDIDITVKEVTNLRAWQTEFQYTPAVLKVTNKSVLTWFLGGTGSNVFDVSDGVPDTDGSYFTGALDMGTPGAHTGSGVLGRLTLQAVGTGVSNITLNLTELVDSNGAPIGDTNSDGKYDGPLFNAAIGVGTPLPDSDSDSLCDAGDNCPNTSNPGQEDTDGDGDGNVCDNCPTLSNPDQADWDHDGTGDACEDSDGDGIYDALDNCPGVANPNQADWDHDGTGDVCDPDDDNDGFCDPGVVDPSCTGSDNCPHDANADQKNTDGDPLGDACDPDDDGDGFTDARESAAAANPLNSNSTPEVCDGADNDGDTLTDEGYDYNSNTIPDCTEAGLDTDGDMRAESGPECANYLDDDSDTKVNDGCPAQGAGESGAQCDNATDDDSDGKINDGCPTAGYANPTDTDDDNDGFLDTKENWMGTDSLDACRDDVNDQAWPPDFDNSGTVNILDVVFFKPVLGSHFGGSNPKDPYYDRRYDFNVDTYINILDVVGVKPYLGRSCS